MDEDAGVDGLALAGLGVAPGLAEEAAGVEDAGLAEEDEAVAGFALAVVLGLLLVFGLGAAGVAAGVVECEEELLLDDPHPLWRPWLVEAPWPLEPRPPKP